MKITKQQLVDFGACSEGLEWFEKQKSHELTDLLKAAIKEGRDSMAFASWGIVRFMTHKQKVQYAVFAAKQVLGIFKERYPKDLRPRQAIEAAEKWIEDPTQKNKNAAYAAAHAAYAAAHARLRLTAKILRYGVKLLMNTQEK